jgi:hypothetical protein
MDTGILPFYFLIFILFYPLLGRVIVLPELEEELEDELDEGV